MKIAKEKFQHVSSETNHNCANPSCTCNTCYCEDACNGNDGTCGCCCCH